MNHIKTKKYFLGMFLVYFTALTWINAQINQGQLRSMVVKDETLIVPGIGASSTLINMPEQEVLLIKGTPFEKTQHVAHDFFKDVLKLQSEIALPFNYLYTYRNPLTIIGLYNGRVSFVVVWGSHGILIDGIRVSKGIAAIVFNYGNEGMQVLKDEDGSIYMYKSKGIAFIDEKSDDTVDGIIIFKGSSN
ncbi:MAG: hypothetical protein WBK20_00210 [Spirochaetota bacterium]